MQRGCEELCSYSVGVWKSRYFTCTIYIVLINIQVWYHRLSYNVPDTCMNTLSLIHTCRMYLPIYIYIYVHRGAYNNCTIWLSKVSKSLTLTQYTMVYTLIYMYVPASGDGKTHYIKEQLRKSSTSLTVAVNEAFTPLSAIKKLRKLHPSQRNCAIFLNFTMLPPGVRLHSYFNVGFTYMYNHSLFTLHSIPMCMHVRMKVLKWHSHMLFLGSNSFNFLMCM